jgi:hypothetical protein
MLLLSLVVVVGAQAQPPQGRGGPTNWRFVDAEIGRPGEVVKSAPFSAVVTTESSMLLQDGNHIHQTSTLHLYRDSDGRTRREQSLSNVGGSAGDSVVFINDPVAGMNYALNPSAKTATRSANGPGRGPQGNRGGRMRGGPGRGPGQQTGQQTGRQNVSTEALGSKSIEGVMAVGSRTTITTPAGQVGNEQPLHTVVETWYSADLKTVVLSKRSDPRSGDTITRYTNITRSEPVHSLFEVPGDYKVSDSAGRGPTKTDAK